MGTLLIVIGIFVFFFGMKSIVVVQQAEVMVIERLGRFHRLLDSGIHIIFPILDKPRAMKVKKVQMYQGQHYATLRTVTRIDLRESVYDFPRQNVITKDNVTLEIDALLYFQITDPQKAMYEIENLSEAIEKLTQTTLRNITGKMTLDETLVSRDTINFELRTILDEATDKWGVKVNRVELKDITPPEEIRSAMEKQMRAERDKRAMILEAEGMKNSAILKAEGAKEAVILEAEASKQQKILDAEGFAEARIKIAEAESVAITKVSAAIGSTGTKPGDYLIAVKYIEAYREMIKHGDKTVLMPYEATGVLSSLEAIKTMFNSDKK